MKNWYSKQAIRMSVLLPLLLLAAPAQAELGINFPEPASSGARDIYDIHMFTLSIATVLMLVVAALVVYSVIFHRKSRGAIPDENFHTTRFGTWSWLAVPAIVLGVDLALAGSAQEVLERIWTPPDDTEMLEVKVIGHQWWWEFEYLDHGLKVESRFVPKDQAGSNYLREVDNRLVLPTHRPIRFLHTSADVLHAFWVPELGFKKDAIPGYITETWTELDKEGLFRGQCAELCGTWHARMPTVIEAVSPARFAEWVEEQQVLKVAAAEEAASDREWTMDELMARGETEYNGKCAACHQVSGEGMPPAFPALKGSAVATGPLERHLDVVLHGVPGTAMQPWSQLTDLEIAAMVTYERNAWGNQTGDVVQPAQVKAAR